MIILSRALFFSDASSAVCANGTNERMLRQGTALSGATVDTPGSASLQYESNGRVANAQTFTVCVDDMDEALQDAILSGVLADRDASDINDVNSKIISQNQEEISPLNQQASFNNESNQQSNRRTQNSVAKIETEGTDNNEFHYRNYLDQLEIDLDVA